MPTPSELPKTRAPADRHRAAPPILQCLASVPANAGNRRSSSTFRGRACSAVWLLRAGRARRIRQLGAPRPNARRDQACGTRAADAETSSGAAGATESRCGSATMLVERQSTFHYPPSNRRALRVYQRCWSSSNHLEVITGISLRSRRAAPNTLGCDYSGRSSTMALLTEPNTIAAPAARTHRSGRALFSYLIRTLSPRRVRADLPPPGGRTAGRHGHEVRPEHNAQSAWLLRPGRATHSFVTLSPSVFTLLRAGRPGAGGQRLVPLGDPRRTRRDAQLGASGGPPAGIARSRTL